MQSQLLLPLKHISKYEGELVYGSCNADAIAWCDRYPDWPIQFVHIYGPAYSGKSTLAGLFYKKANGLLVDGAEASLEAIPEDKPLIMDDAHLCYEETLFHLYNRAFQSKLPLILFSPKSFATWDCKIADLSSRLSTFYEIELKEPDDLTFRLLLLKELQSIGVHFSESIIELFLTKAERSFKFIQAFIQHTKSYTLEKQKSINRNDALEFLQIFEECKS